ncbi:MAG: hypothetical protein CUN49_09640 [Candidatus Thermofonsia Clade 1 bacterium]|jgi:hypothetical protein|uniref:Uncharacterized protein n=1 Tax=Candidatus Thermofonsia Clade 1 bacterium TaxID=2364210 RepID=A0A2M8PDI9_9CHLR|nr:MAG: hypothetical protein CUN49_09640 [Candidatus Thermofonsia Clade 1 bacterium]PJF42421.1 MAG: hypothetical protein CUN50_04225 [Candidatus Thermofonsia Clade 1 bacterium]
MSRSVYFGAALAAVLFLGLLAFAPAKAYGVSTSGCTITLTVEDNDDPTYYKIGAIEGSWPYDGSRPLPSVSATMPSSGTYPVEVYYPFFSSNVTVACDEFPAEPLDPVAGEGDPDLVVDTIVLIEDTDGVIREGQAFARLLRPTYLGNRSIIDIPYIRAADVFVFFKGKTYKGSFYTPLRVCLRGNGQLLFASVQGRPRQFGPALIAPNTGRRNFQCAWLIEPGTLALVAAR